MGQLASEWMRLASTHAWQVTALIVFTAIAVRLLARNRPHLAFVLWLLVLVKCVTPPVWSSPSGVFSWLHPSGAAAPAESPLPPGGVVHSEQHDVGTAANTANFVSSPRPIDAQRPTPLARNRDSKSSVATDSARRPSAIGHVMATNRCVVALLFIWAFGTASIVSVSILRCLGYCWRLKRHGCVEEPRMTDLVRDLSRRLRVKRPVRLLVTTSRTGPAVIGLLRPTVLLPATLVKGKSNEELKPLLAHELIHVRRGDLWYGMLQVVAQALWWCHPLVWWAGRRASREAERCCDEEVVAELGCSSARYARSLLEVLELKKTLKPVPAFPGVRPVEITSNRLERIMKLGQGCHRRTPWWCWLVLLISAAVMLPGAAYFAGEKDEPVRCLTPPRDQPVAAIPPLPRNVPDEPLLTRIYEVADLIDKVRLEHDTDIETAKTMVIGHIRVSAFVPSPERETSESQSNEMTDGSEDAGRKPSKQKQRPRVEWSDNKLIVSQTAAWHERIAWMLEVLRKYGFGQVLIETRLVTGPAEAINSIGSNWTIMETEVETDEQPTHQDPNDPLRAFRHPPIDLQEVPDLPLPETRPQRRTRAQTVVEKRLPVMIEVMDDRRVSKVIGQLQGDSRVNLFTSPKVTTLNGQSALVSDCSQRPFVVGIDDGAPQIRIVDEGFTMQLRPIRRKDASIWLDYVLTLASIHDVETTTIPSANGQTGTTLQVPVVAKTQLEASVEVSSGKTLVIGGLRMTDDEGKEQSMLVMLRTTALALPVGVGVADKPSGRLMSGVGVKSDAGVTGKIVLDSERLAANPPSEAKAAEKPPSPSLLSRPIIAAHSCRLHKLDAMQTKAATLEIKKCLERKIMLNLEQTPLSAALDEIGKKAELNMMIDTAGIHEEGVTVNEPITINLSSPISVESALNLY